MTDDSPVRRRALGAALVTLVSIGVVAPYVFPMTSISTISYDWVDADLFLWNFWWTKYALATAHNPYWTDLLMYPAGASLGFHTYPMPYSLLTVPIQAAIADTRGLVVSFNAIVLISSVASGLGAYFLALRVTRSVTAAVIAGIVFVSAPYRAMNISRLHVIATEVLAWYAWAWTGFAEAPRRSRAVVLGGLLAIAVHTSPEYALHCTLFSALWLLWMWMKSRPLPPIFFRRLILAAVVFVVLAFPLLAMQASSVGRGEASLVRVLGDVGTWSPALVSFITPSRAHPIFGSLFSAAGDYGTPNITGMRSETTVALTIWMLGLAAAVRMRRDGSTFWFIAAGAFLILTLGPYLRLTGTVSTPIPLPYAVLYWVVPPLQFARDPTRFFAIALLMLSVASAFGVRALIESARGNVRPALTAAVIAALVIFEGMTSRVARVPSEALISPAYDAVAAAGGQFAVVDLSPDQTALLAQTRHHRPITGGRTSNPRAAAGSPRLGVERDFQNAGATLALDAAALESRLMNDRQELDRLRLRFVIFPAGDPARVELAQRMGFRVSTAGEHVVCER
jgi:hypothetical protein